MERIVKERPIHRLLRDALWKTKKNQNEVKSESRGR